MMAEIIDRIIKDTKEGKCRWTRGAHSDLWSADGPGYSLMETAGNFITKWFVMSVNGGSLKLRISYGKWRELKAAIPNDGHITPEQALKRMR